MLKKCNVLLNNGLVAVIDYDGKQIQIPAIKSKESVVMVLDDGTYTVVDKDYIEKNEKARPTRAKKKTTI